MFEKKSCLWSFGLRSVMEKNVIKRKQISRNILLVFTFYGETYMKILFSYTEEQDANVL